MSYQFELPRVQSADLDDAIRERADNWAARTSMSEEERDAFTEHVEGITHALEAMASWMGSEDQELRCVVTGHANPGHKPREGYSDEHITISIGVLPAEGQAVPAEPEAVVLKSDEQMMDNLVAGS